MSKPMILDCPGINRVSHPDHKGKCWREATPEDGNLEALSNFLRQHVRETKISFSLLAEGAATAWLGVSE